MVGFAVPRAHLALGLKNQATSFLDLHTLAMDDRKVFKCAITLVTPPINMPNHRPGVLQGISVDIRPTDSVVINTIHK